MKHLSAGGILSIFFILFYMLITSNMIDEPKQLCATPFSIRDSIILSFLAVILFLSGTEIGHAFKKAGYQHSGTSSCLFAFPIAGFIGFTIGCIGRKYIYCNSPKYDFLDWVLCMAGVIIVVLLGILAETTTDERETENL